MGNIYDEIQQTPVSYMQACSAIDYRLVRGNGSIIHYSAVSSLIEYVVSYPNRNLENLKYYIRQGDIESIDSFLNDTLQDDLINSIRIYINENYQNSNFTVQMMADRFDVSLTNISQYFKSRTGQTIIDYITRLRIAKAKELLLNTTMSVNDIALQVGYLNSSSFIRRFKQITKLTPMQFLKANK